MKTDLSHLPEHKQAELKAIVAALIPRYAEIEMIILFGSFARGTWVEDKYVEKGITYEYKSDYDLLIVLSKNAHANSNTLTQSITGKLEELNFSTPMNPIFHGVEFVNHELREGNYFFAEIKRDGVLLFTTNRYQLEEKRELAPQKRRPKLPSTLKLGLKVLMIFCKDLTISSKESDTTKPHSNFIRQQNVTTVLSN